MSCTNWYADRLPNVWRSRAYSTERSRHADHAARAGRDGEAALVERVHRDLEALALFADQVLGGNLDVLEEELAGRAGPDAELVLVSRAR
jgi:hypothetical protein